ncbi:MAG: hypothetical protein JW724_03745 [Candidatus Altiarchaeota archaeon]|nr:hypothetical protein [Candidatus Altiarchaeota archaeon]
MMSPHANFPEKSIEEELNYKLFKGYGTRLVINKVEPVENRKYRVSFNYNKVFNIVDEKQRKIYVRNIFFENIHIQNVSPGEELRVPILEVNKAIENEFIGLRNDLFQKVISNREIVMNILKNVHLIPAFLNKFYTLLRDLAEEDVISREYLGEYLESDKRYEKYIALIIDSGLAKYNNRGDLKASSTYKKMMENRKDVPAAIDEAVSKIVTDNYGYIIQELGLKHIKPYINVISCIYYANNNINIKDLTIEELYKIHKHLYGTLRRIRFKEKISSLVSANIISREGDSIRLAMPLT